MADAAYPHPAVTVYAPGSSKPLRKLTEGITGPTELAFDPLNNLFVMNVPVNGTRSIVEYAASSAKVLRNITRGISSPQAIALDGSGTLYVSNAPFPSQGWVSVYAPGASTPSYRITSQMHDPQLLAVDGEGNLYVGNDYYAMPSTATRHPPAIAEACVSTRQKPRRPRVAFQTSNTAIRIRWL